MIMPWLITDSFKLRTKQRKPNTHPHQSPRMSHFCLACLQLSPANSLQSGQTGSLSFFIFAFESAKTQVVNKQTWLFSSDWSWFISTAVWMSGWAGHRETCHRYWFSVFLGNCSGMLKNAFILCKLYYFNWESLGTALLLTHGTIIYLMVMVMQTMVVMWMRRTTGIITTNIDWTLAGCQVLWEAHWLHN